MTHSRCCHFSRDRNSDTVHTTQEGWVVVKRLMFLKAIVVLGQKHFNNEDVIHRLQTHS